MALFLFCYLFVVLLENEWVPPLLHVQDKGPGLLPRQGVPYYFCYKYPRLNYWINKAIDWLRGINNEQHDK